MGVLGKIILFLVSLALVVGAFYLIFQKRVFSYFWPDLNWEKASKIVGIRLPVRDKMESGVEGIKNRLEKGASESKKYAEENLERVKAGYFTDVKEKVTGAVEQAIQTIGETLGIKKETSGEVTIGLEANPSAAGSLLIYSSVKLNEEARFAVRNLTDEDSVVFEVDWGDGRREDGSLKKGEVKPLSHRWGKEGDYLVNLKMNNRGGGVSQKLPIYVFE